MWEKKNQHQRRRRRRHKQKRQYGWGRWNHTIHVTNIIIKLHTENSPFFQSQKSDKMNPQGPQTVRIISISIVINDSDTIRTKSIFLFRSIDQCTRASVCVTVSLSLFPSVWEECNKNFLFYYYRCGCYFTQLKR